MALAYDANGNLAGDPLAPNVGSTSPPAGQTYVYDLANRVVEVRRTQDGQTLQKMAYDALGRRVCTTAYVDAATGSALAAPTVTWHVMFGPQTIQDYKVTGGGALPVTATLQREYLWGERFPEPVALVDMTDAGDEQAGTPEVFTYLLDALGSVVALADDSGAVVEQYVYDPYGQTYIEDAAGQSRPTSAYGNPFMWTGQRYDAATGLYHFTFRTYSPTLGRIETGTQLVIDIANRLE